MNYNIGDDHPSIFYYDSDYPSEEHGLYFENFDEVTEFQGISHDVARYKELAHDYGGPILELCCGTGRIAIPLAQAGFQVIGVDISYGMLQRFKTNLKRVKDTIRSHIQIIEQDVTELSLDGQQFRLAIMAFNSFLCITDFENQCRTLKAVSKHMSAGGILALDVVNPLCLNLQGEHLPKPFFTRKNEATGARYTRIAMADAIDENQRQRLHGWYDEIDITGTVKRKYYSLYWRPVFRFELELMLQQAGFTVFSIEGGHRKEIYTAQSHRIFLCARKE